MSLRRGDIRDSMMPRGFSVLEEASGAAGGGAPAPPGIARNKSATLIQKMFRGNLARREPPPKQVEFSLARPPPIFVGADEPSAAVVTAAPPSTSRPTITIRWSGACVEEEPRRCAEVVEEDKVAAVSIALALGSVGYEEGISRSCIEGKLQVLTNARRK